MFRVFKFSLTFVLATWAAVVSADVLPPPDGPVLLTVTGQIANENVSGAAQFDRTMLRDLDWREIRTFTSFTDGEQSFAGPSLSSVLSAVGAQGAMLRAQAINDYSVPIPVEHADAHDVILAMEWNGTRMRIRDKGPIWVVYPLDEATAETQRFDAEMIWQLDRIAVE